MKKRMKDEVVIPVCLESFLAVNALEQKKRFRTSRNDDPKRRETGMKNRR